MAQPTPTYTTIGTITYTEAQQSATPSISIGSLPIAKAFLGTSDITKITLGNVTLYEAQAPAQYSVSVSVTDGSYSGDSTIAAGSTATVTISADSGYELPSSLSVSGASYTYNQSTGVVSLSNATGNVTISAVCEQVSGVDAIAQFVEDGVPSGAYENDLVETVSGYVFYNCTSLTSVSFPSAISVGNYAFNGCTSLTSVSIPNVVKLWPNAFQACSSLASISIPNAEEIGSSAFLNCTSLRTLYVGTNKSSVCLLGGSLPTTIQTIYVPSALVEDYKAAQNWSASASKIVGV